MAGSSFTSSSRPKKRVLRGVVFLVFLLAAALLTLVLINNSYDEVAAKNESNVYSERRFKEFYETEKNTIDMVFVGSSHSYCSFDPENFDSRLGSNSFQLGMPLQRPDATYFTLREVYNYQKPKVVVMEAYWNMFSGNSEIRQAKTLFQSLKNPELEAEYLDTVFSASEKLRYNIPLFNYQKDYFSFSSKGILENMEENWDLTPYREADQNEYYKDRGYVFCDSTMAADEFGRTNQFNGADGRNFEMSKIQISYLEKIAELCEQNGSTLILVTAPVANTSLSRIKNYDLIHKKMTELAASINVQYIDYNELQYMFNDANFRDDAHMNDSGVKILNAHFADFLENSNYFKKKSVNVPIIMYHHFDSNPDTWGEATMSPKLFKEHMTALKNAGYTAVSYKELYDFTKNNGTLPEKPIIITMDDGYYSNYEYAYNTLKELGMKGCISIIGWSVGETEYKDKSFKIIPHFTWSEAREMTDSGVIEIQSHTFDLHENGKMLSLRNGVSKLPDESDEEYYQIIYQDFLKSFEQIEENLWIAPLVLTYPYGIYTDISEKAALDAGYLITVSTDKGINEISIGDDLKALKRYNIPAEMNSEELLNLIGVME